MNQNLGQQRDVWDDWWGKITPESEIRMWDFYGGRQWISKYVPRYGKVVEGGCGVGRYNFYFTKLGIDIDGLDFSNVVIERLKAVKDRIDSRASFVLGDVTNLPYADNSISGYISLGVVEHFIEGPAKPISEAYRALRPGGVAIITTPNRSFGIRRREIKSGLKNFIKRFIGKEIKTPPFFQYEYSPRQLKRFCEEQGFYVSRFEGCDLLYVFYELGGFTGENIQKGSVAYGLSKLLENTPLKYYGAQSITISIKVADVMHCFLSGKLNASRESLELFDVPISEEMQQSPLAKFFKKGRNVKFGAPYIMNPPILESRQAKCAISGNVFNTDMYFENFGFSIDVSLEELRKPAVNIQCAAEHIQPIWRNRIAK